MRGQYFPLGHHKNKVSILATSNGVNNLRVLLDDLEVPLFLVDRVLKDMLLLLLPLLLLLLSLFLVLLLFLFAVCTVAEDDDAILYC